MKSNILKTIGVIIVLIVIGLLFKQTNYGTSQVMASVAAQQVNDDSAYFALNSNNTLTTIYNVIYTFVTIGALSLFYFIWKPKKVTESEPEK